MAMTLQQTINWSQTFIQYAPLTNGVGYEPAISIANMVQNTIVNAPFTWSWNRNENTSLTLTANTQDYTVNITDFSFLEKVTLKTTDGKYSFELKDVYNTNILGLSVSQPAEPKSVAVKFVTYGTSIALRFLAIPDQNYSSVLTYQKLVTPFSNSIAPSAQSWVIPDQYQDIYNNLFLAECFQAADDDQQAARYRVRGVAALLAKAEGLTELQRNAYLSQFLVRAGQAESMGLRVQQGNQARGV